MLREAAVIYRERGNISGWADIANNLGQAQCQLRRFADGVPNREAALDYFERSGQTALARSSPRGLAVLPTARCCDARAMDRSTSGR